MFQILLAGLLSIPCFVLAICVAPILGVLSIPTLWLLLHRTKPSSLSSSQHLPDQVLIAGGSSGIGLAIAKECVRRGIPTITLLARDVRKLQHAQMELEALAHSTTSSSGSTTLTTIRVRSVNITDAAELEQHAKDLSIPSTDRVVVWNCAGFSYPGEFLTVPIEKIQEQVQTNQIGTLYLVRAFLPYLHQGCIVLTSSAAGQIGVYGYTTYAPTKYAIRGFAETLHAELLLSHPHISLQIAYPIDTDTPGYQEELKTTPELTKKLSETAGAVATAHQTAKAMVDAAFVSQPKFHVYFTVEGWMLSNLTAGMSPVTHLADAMAQVALGGIFRMIGLFVLNDWWNTIRTHSATTTTTTGTTTTSAPTTTTNSTTTTLTSGTTTKKKN